MLSVRRKAGVIPWLLAITVTEVLIVASCRSTASTPIWSVAMLIVCTRLPSTWLWHTKYGRREGGQHGQRITTERTGSF